MEPELHVAIRKGQFHDIRLLVSAGMDVNVRDNEGKTPLITCTFLCQEDWAVGIARMILQNGGLIGMKDKSGRNGLMYAAIFQRLELVRLFLNAVDYNINDTDRFGNSALFYAASAGDAVVTHEIVQRLKHFKMSMDISNKWGMTPLMEACRLGHKECSSVLRNVGLSDETVCDKILGWNAQKWATERDREVEARQRKRSLYEKPWLENSKGKQNSPTDVLISSLSSNDGSWFTRSVSLSSSVSSSCLSSTTEPRQEKLPMLKCRRRIKIEKIKRNWVAETVSKNTIEVKYQPSPLNYAVISANRVPGGISTGKKTRPVGLKMHQLPEHYNSQPWLDDFKQIFRQYELQVTDSYRKTAVAPIHQEVALSQVIVKKGAKERDDDKKVLDHRQNAMRGSNGDGKTMSSWPSLSSVASGKKSRTADDIVDIFLGSARSKKEGFTQSNEAESQRRKGRSGKGTLGKIRQRKEVQ